jgi:hypothetical protein
MRLIVSDVNMNPSEIVMKDFKGYIHRWRKRHFADGFIITGIPRGHPDFKDWIHTSKVIYLDEYDNTVETMNSRYQLIGTELTS